jgi:hypothetical protein
MNIGVFRYAGDKKSGVFQTSGRQMANILGRCIFSGQAGCDAWIVLPVTQVALLHSSANTYGHDGDRTL